MIYGLSYLRFNPDGLHRLDARHESVLKSRARDFRFVNEYSRRCCCEFTTFAWLSEFRLYVHLTLSRPGGGGGGAESARADFER